MSVALPNLPNGWKGVCLGDVLSGIEAGVSPKALDRPAQAHELGVLKVSAVTWNEFRPYENKALPHDFDAEDCPRVCQGDLLLSRANTAELLAAPVIARNSYPNLLLSDKILRLVPKSDVGHAPYLLYVLRTQVARRYFESHATGTSGSMRNVSQATICACPIPLPPLAEQRRIAAILDKAEAIQRKQQRVIARMENFLRAVFLDMFGDPVKNPKGWEVRSLAELAGIQGGLQLTPKRALNPMELPYLRVANVYRDKLVLDDIKYIRVTKEESSKVALQCGDILIVEGHGNPEEIGRSAVWDGSIEPCVHQNHLIRIRLKREAAEPVYVSTYLNSQGGRQQLFRFGKTTSGLNTINISNVKNTVVMLPPIQLQRQFTTLANQNKKISDKFEQQAEYLNRAFNSLARLAFRGDLTRDATDKILRQVAAN